MPPSAAATRSGSAGASAAMTMSASFGCVSVLPPTDGPGYTTFTADAGRGDDPDRPVAPEFFGMWWSVRWKTAL